MKNQVLRGVIVALLVYAIIEFFVVRRDKKLKPGNKQPRQPISGNKDDPQYSLLKIADSYGREIAENVEKIYAHETTGFTSQQYMIGRSAGMEASKKSLDKLPYGWGSMASFWVLNPAMAPIGLDHWESDSGGREAYFLVFPNLLSGAYALAEVLKKRNNNPGAWFSRDPKQQLSYNRAIQKQKIKFLA